MANRNYQPTPENKRRYKFTFGLWTFRHRGADPFGEPTKTALPVQEGLRGLAARYVYGFNFHDDDLVPFGSTARQRDAILRETQQTMRDHNIVAAMGTTNLFYKDVFKDGAFTSSDPKIRAYAVQKAMRGIDLAVSLGAKIYVFWGGREGAEVDAAKNPMEALNWYREAINFLSNYVKEQAKHDSAYQGVVFALEAKPNEPRGDIYLATTGHMLGFIATLDNREMIGVNPEFGHELMAGLNFYHTLCQAKDAGKLFHVDLNTQRPLRFDEDRRFGAQVLQDAFWVVRALESGYAGPRHYDCHPSRAEDLEGAWSFVEGCMEQYLILAEKNEILNQDPEMQGYLKARESLRHPEIEQMLGKPSLENFQKLREMNFDLESLARTPLKLEAMDRRFNRILTGTQ